VPGERTVTLLAGVFGCEPFDLVDGTDYPIAKAERLPIVTARHTEVDMQLALADAQLAVVTDTRLRDDLRAEWQARLAALLDRSRDPRETARLRATLERLR
jgi:hypothetical protein